MDRFFKKLSLPLKLFLLVLLPLTLIVFLTIEVNRDKTEKVHLIDSYVRGIKQSVDISSLLNQLQLERRHSYAFAVKKDSASIIETKKHWLITDSAINILDAYKDGLALKDFRVYTFLDKLDSMRNAVTAGADPDVVMHFYTTTIFRLKTLSGAEYTNNNLLTPVSPGISAGNILNEMSTYLGIIRSNFYNTLYRGQNNIPMLYGLMGTYDIFKSYEKELLVKAGPEVLASYDSLRSGAELRTTLAYIDTVFKRFSFDTLYNAENWWIISGIATDQLKTLQQRVMADVKRRVEAKYNKEFNSRNWNLIFLVLAVTLVLTIMSYTTRIITQMLQALNRSAERIAIGDSPIPISPVPNDVIGSLTRSIESIHKTNKKLTQAARSIGQSDFSVAITPRSEKDELSHAILAMKNGLEKFTKEIEQTKEQFKKIADTAPVMIWMTDTEGAAIFMNEGWLRFTGRTREEELGHGWEKGIHPDDVFKCASIFGEALVSRRSYHVEYRLMSRDGKYRWLSENGLPRYTASGVFEGYIGTCSDINEIKELDRRKDEFIIMASHELKTPITSIKGYVQLLTTMFREYERTREFPAESSVKSSLSTMEKQVNKLVRLLTELLDLSRLESGVMELEKKEFNLNELVQDTIEEVQYTAPHHPIHFEAKGTFHVHADQDRIEQVMLNLLINAIKYSPDADPIKVSIQGTGNGMVRVLVRDNGIGIDKKEQSRIFDRFYRVEGKTEQTYPGFGIGLYIAHEIIQRHGGSLWVDSEKGKGAEFSFTVPASENGLT